MKVLKLILQLSLFLTLSSCGQKTADEHLETAKNHLKNNEQSDAIIAFKNVLQSQPNHLDARISLAQLYLTQGHIDFAEKEYSIVVENNAGTESSYANLAKIYNLLNNYNSTINLSEYTPSNWENIELHSAFIYQKAIAHFRLNEPNLGKLELDLLKANAPDTLYGRLGSIYSDSEKNLKAASYEISLLSEEFPLESDVLFLKGLILGANKSYDEAAKAFKQHLELLPNYHQIKLYYADALIKAKDYKTAETQIKALLKLTSENAYVNQLYGFVKFESKDYEASQLHFEKAIQNGINSTTNRLMAGISAFQNQNYEQAHQYLISITDKVQSDHPSMKILAITQLQLGYVLDATDTMMELSAVSELDSTMIAAASYELIKDGKFTEAKKLINRSDGIDDKNSSNLVRRGILKLNLNELDGLVDLEQAVKIDPTLSVAKSALASAYLKTASYEKGLALAEEWQSQNDIAGYNLAGYIYLKQNLNDKAENAFQSALKLDSNNSPSLMFLASKSLTDEKYQEAKTFLSRLFKKEPDNLKALKMFYIIGQKEGDTSKALNLMHQRFEQNIDSEPHRMQLAQLYVAEKKPNQVIKTLQRENFTPSESTNDFYWFALADSLEAINKNIEALTILGHWTTIRPKLNIAWVKKFTLEDKLNKNNAATNTIRNAITNLPEDKGLRVLEINQLIKNNQLDIAESKVEQYFAQELNNIVIKFLRGQIYLNQFEFNKSLSLFNDYYEIRKTSEVARYIFASYLGLKQEVEGLAFLERHVEQAPNDIANLVLLANQYLNTDSNKAQTYYKNILSQLPTNLMALNNLAWLQSENNELLLAKNTIDKALDIYNDHPSILDTGAVIYEKLGEIDKAKVLIQKAFKLANSSPLIKQNYDRIINNFNE